MGYSWLDKLDAKVESISYTECFEKACPVFMTYGLSYEDFWYGDCYKAKYQRESYLINIRKQDELMWEQGMYIYEAILDCAPILHPFSKEKKPRPYTEKPHLYKPTEQEMRQQEEQEAEQERLKAQILLNNWVRSMKNK